MSHYFMIYNYIDCLCNFGGSLKNDGLVCTSNDPCHCDLNGQCTCTLGYKGEKCNKCEAGFFDLDGSDYDSFAYCTSKSTITNMGTAYLFHHIFIQVVYVILKAHWNLMVLFVLWLIHVHVIQMDFVHVK